MNFYASKNVVVTGGAGFLGSNLTHALVDAGAKVEVIDSFHPDYGGNAFNLQSLEGRITVHKEDIQNLEKMKSIIHHADVVFHLAAQCSHVDSMTNPWMDLDFNNKGTLCILEAAKNSPKKPSVVYVSTRAVVGAPHEIPANEKTLPNPVDIYGVNKYAAELYGAVYARVFQVPVVSLRLTNCYGPRHQMRNAKYGILNWFLSQMLQKKPVKIFGDGKQLRDYLYVDDAVDAFLRAGEFTEKKLRNVASLSADEKRTLPLSSGENIPYAVFNIATGNGIEFQEATKRMANSVTAELQFVPWPADRKAIETGDFVADPQAALKAFGWKPSTSFEVGIEKTITYYKEFLKHYV